MQLQESNVDNAHEPTQVSISGRRHDAILSSTTRAQRLLHEWQEQLQQQQVSAQKLLHDWQQKMDTMTQKLDAR